MAWWRRQNRSATTGEELVTSAYGRHMMAAAATQAAVTGAQESAARLWSAAFAAAQPATDGPSDPWGPRLRMQAGRALIHSGEWWAVIRLAGDGSPMLYPFTSASVVRGGPEPSSWLLYGSVAAPSAVTSNSYLFDETVQIVWNTDPSSPWRGVGPLSKPALTRHLAAQTEAAAVGEVSLQAGQFFLTPPTDAKIRQDLRDGLKRRAEQGSRAPFFVLGDAYDAQQSPGQSYGVFGVRFEEALVSLRQSVAETILECCGIPPSVWSSNSGQSSREGSRVFVETAVKPMLEAVSVELSHKLDGDFTYTLPDRWCPDPAATARALKQLVESGVPLADARIALEV